MLTPGKMFDLRSLLNIFQSQIALNQRPDLLGVKDVFQPNQKPIGNAESKIHATIRGPSSSEFNPAMLRISGKEIGLNAWAQMNQ
jgi:hypothetical protein